MYIRTVLLLGGRANSGKDFTADVLVNRHGWVKLPLAKKLKQLTSKIYKISLDDLNTQQGKKKLHSNGKTYRELLIDTAIIYKKDDINYFVKEVVKDIKSTDKNVVISDFRFPHEYECIKNCLSNDICVKTCLVFREQQFKMNVVSENSLNHFDFDFKIHNNSYTNIEEELLNNL